MKQQIWKVMAPVLAAVLTVPSVSMPAHAAKSGISMTKCILTKGDQVDLNITGDQETSGTYATSKKQVVSVAENGVVTAKKPERQRFHGQKAVKIHLYRTGS